MRKYFAWIKLLTLLERKYAAEVIQRGWWDYLIRRDENIAATMIQRIWRGHSQQTNYIASIARERAAVTVQKYWRRFWMFSNFIIMLDSAIRIQSVMREHLVRVELEVQHGAAITIQAIVRSFFARRTASSKSMVGALLSSSRARGEIDLEAATFIQRCIRGYQARFAVQVYLKARLIQSAWRSIGPRREFRDFKAAKKIQTTWRMSREVQKFKRHTSAKKLQARWRCHFDNSKYVHYMAARKLQTKWRFFTAYHAFRQYKAALRIQTNWRRHQAMEDYHDLRVVMGSVIRIQSAWRSFVCYTDYIFTLADIVTVQKMARGRAQRKIAAKLSAERERQRALQKRWDSALTIQRVYQGYLARSTVIIMKVYLEHKKRRVASAVLIQSAWRRYDQKQRYWYVLGCAIQLQCFLRGALVRIQTDIQKRAIKEIQRHGRGLIGRNKAQRMRLVVMMIASAERERVQRRAAKKIQAWYVGRTRDVYQTPHAIKIQSFFRMVKAMVDKEIRAEKKRRRLKRLLKDRTAKNDDAVLEDIWMDTISRGGTERDSIRRAERAVSNELKGAHRVAGTAPPRKRSHSLPRNPRSEKQQHRSSSNGRGESGGSSSGSGGGRRRSSSSSRHKKSASSHDLGGYVDTTPQRNNYKRNLLPPKSAASPSSHRTLEPPAETVRYRKRSSSAGRGGGAPHDEDNMSDVSGLTAPSVFNSNHHHHSSSRHRPPSRMDMSDQDMTDDFSLEEAWIDAEIYEAKRRQDEHNTSGRGGASRPQQRQLMGPSPKHPRRQFSNNGGGERHHSKRAPPPQQQMSSSSGVARPPYHPTNASPNGRSSAQQSRGGQTRASRSSTGHHPSTRRL